MTSSDFAIEAEGLVKHFGKTRAVNGIDLRVSNGTVYGVLGPNGAGKTTMVRMLATLIRPDAGRATVLGHDLLREPDAVRARISLTGQFASVDEDLTGRENLILLAKLLGLRGSTGRGRADALLEAFDLTEAANKQAKTYSGGMRRRLDLGASLVANPPVLLLDEPTTGLDPRGRLELWAYLRELVREGTTLFLTTQYLEEADQMANEIVVIDHGAVIAEGTAAELKDRLGGAVLDVTVADDGQIDAALRALEGVGAEAPQVDRTLRRITSPVRPGADSLIDAAKRLDGAGIAVDELAIHRPSLDDVFLSLTGHAIEPEAGDAGSNEGNQQ
jgi:ABC-2 type transport system ATP-binding protein